MVQEKIEWRELLDGATEGAYAMDLDRRILHWNKGAELISGYTSKEVKGTHCWDKVLMHVDDEGRCLCDDGCPAKAAMDTNSSLETRAFLRHRDGHRVPVLIRTLPVRDETGNAAGAIEFFNDDSRSRVQEERLHSLEEMAMADPLTGLGNRRFMEMMLSGRLDRFNRYGWQFGILFLDVDNFKQVNDTHGHEMGDMVLAMIAANMQSNRRGGDSVCRWGGEEFVVLGDHADIVGLTELGERLRRMIASSALWQKEDLRVTVSIGATLVKEGDSAKELIARADTLMYDSKSAGKNCVTVG